MQGPLPLRDNEPATKGVHCERGVWGRGDVDAPATVSNTILDPPLRQKYYFSYMWCYQESEQLLRPWIVEDKGGMRKGDCTHAKIRTRLEVICCVRRCVNILLLRYLIGFSIPDFLDFNYTSSPPQSMRTFYPDPPPPLFLLLLYRRKKTLTLLILENVSLKLFLFL